MAVGSPTTIRKGQRSGTRTFSGETLVYIFRKAPMHSRKKWQVVFVVGRSVTVLIWFDPIRMEPIENPYVDGLLSPSARSASNDDCENGRTAAVVASILHQRQRPSVSRALSAGGSVAQSQREGLQPAFAGRRFDLSWPGAQ